MDVDVWMSGSARFSLWQHINFSGTLGGYDLDFEIAVKPPELRKYVTYTVRLGDEEHLGARKLSLEIHINGFGIFT